MKKTFKGALALAFCIVTIFATMLIASAIGAPKAKVGAVTYNSVTISWAKVKDADFYEVQRSTDGKKWTTLNKAVKGTSYKDSNKLTTGKSYKYRVRAVEDRVVLSDVYSSWSSAVAGKPLPAAVTGLKASSVKYNSAKLSWKKVAGASGYDVQVLNGKTWKSYKKVATNSITVTKLSLGKSYQYRVRAYTTVSKKAIYGAVSSAVKVTPALKAPSTFVLKGITDSSLKLAWSSVEGAKGYEVYNAATKKWTNVKKVTSYTVKNLKAGTKYSFAVRAYSGSYKGTSSATRTYITTPAKPGSLKVSATTSSLTFSWGKVTGAVGYQPAYYDYATKKWTNLSTTTGTSVTIKKLTAGTKYAVRVRAYVKNSNVKDISATAYSSWTSKLDTYTVPAKISSVKLNKVTSSALSLVWSTSKGATSYEYYNPVSKKWVSTGSANKVTVSKLAAGTKYAFKVRAKVSNRTSAETASYTFITNPATPGGVKVTAATTTSLTFTWNKVTGAAGYQPAIYDSTTKKWTNISTTTGNSVTVKDLTAGRKYSVRVRAYVKNTNVKDISATAYSSWSSSVDSYTVPAAPKSISLTAISTSSLSLSWPTVSGATSYEYYNPVSKKWVSTGAANKVTVSSLSAGTKYSFKVRAKVSNRTSAESASYSFTTLTATPGSISVTAATTTSLTFSWSKVTGAAGYQPAIYDSVTKKWTSISTTTGTSVTVKDLTAGRKYTVRVRAYVKNSNVSGISGTTYTAWKTSGDTYTVPSAPKSISLTDISTSSLSLSWPTVSGATSYEYYNPVSKKWVSTGSANKVTVSSLSAGTKYSFKVRAKVSDRTSAESASYSFTTLTAKVSGLKAGSISDTSLTVSWSAVTGASGYQVDYKKASASSWTKLTTTTSTSAKASGLTSYTDYQFRVRAYVKNSNVSGIDATAYGSYSSTLNTITCISAPVLKSTGTSKDTITLSWAAVTGATGYTVEKYDSLQSEWMVYDFNAAKWNYYEYLSADSNITTTALSMADKGKSTNTTRADVYRVIAQDSKHQYAIESEPVTGYTSDLAIIIGDFDVTLELPVSADMDLYQFYSINPDNTNELLCEIPTSSLSKTADGKYTIKLNLAPASYHSLLVIAKNTSTKVATKVTEWMTFLTKDLKIVNSTSDSNYNASVNSQLLYLARAINNTKYYTGEITVKNQSEVSYSIDYLKIKIPLSLIPYEAKSAKEVSDLFKTLGKLFGEDIDFPTEESDKVDTTLSFVDGKCINESNTNAKLKLFIEPTSNDKKTAYVYNSLTNQSAWKNGFESVTTTKNSDGGYTINAKLKKESTNTNYHSGFISSFDLTDFSGEGFEMEYFNVGGSTINAVIDSEGYLKSYSANAPYAARMSADMLGTMTMNMSGKTTFNYTITR